MLSLTRLVLMEPHSEAGETILLTLGNDDFFVWRACESAPPREASALMSWAASKAVGQVVYASRIARLITWFRIVHCSHPRLPDRGCIGGLALVRIGRWTLRKRSPRNVLQKSFVLCRIAGQ